jgi:hypothetical protein
MVEHNNCLKGMGKNEDADQQQELDVHIKKQNLNWPTASQEELLYMVSRTE